MESPSGPAPQADASHVAATPPVVAPSSATPAPVAADHHHAAKRPWIKWAIFAAIAVVAAWLLGPWVVLSLNTVSTDDAYVDGHVTFVAPRVAGQVSKVFVDDNMRVKRGDVLVQIDPEPFRV